MDTVLWRHTTPERAFAAMRDVRDRNLDRGAYMLDRVRMQFEVNGKPYLVRIGEQFFERIV